VTRLDGIELWFYMVSAVLLLSFAEGLSAGRDFGLKMPRISLLRDSRSSPKSKHLRYCILPGINCSTNEFDLRVTTSQVCGWHFNPTPISSAKITDNY